MLITAIDTAASLLRGKKGEEFGACESASLRLEKFVRLGDNTKKEEIASVVSTAKQTVPPFVPAKAELFAARLGGRLIVNQTGGILENAGLCLHPHFNAPYIPGSALKGVARHAAWCEWHDAAEESPRKAELARKIAEVFGYPTNEEGLDSSLPDEMRSGTVAFMPAYPDRTAGLVVDIVNCHHPKYYTGDEKFRDAPDTEAPNPQFFPAVEAGTQFIFALVPLRPDADVAAARTWLIKALTENGVGAKTSAGYGWFVYSDEDNQKWLDDRTLRIKQEQRRRQAEEAVTVCEVALSDLEGTCGEKLDQEQCRKLDEALKRKDALKELLGGLNDVSGLQRSFEEIVRRCKVLEEKRPQLSLEDQIRQAWEGKSIRDQVLTPYIQLFESRDSATQTAVVKVLRTHALWQYLRQGNFAELKKKNLIQTVRTQVERIRAFAKALPEGKLK